MSAFNVREVIGYAAVLFPAAVVWMLSASATQAGSPSFNCARADSRAEELICGDQELAQMDVEAARLFKLARDGKGVSAKQKTGLNDERVDWLKMRDECRFTENMRNCIIAAYAVRIHWLREKHRATLVNDDKGITRGPLALRCDKFGKTLVKATFIKSNPPVGALQLPERVHVGIAAGGRYIEESDTGERLAFWLQGDKAFLQMPNGKRIACRLEKAK